MRFIDLDLLIGDLAVRPLIDAAERARVAILSEPDSERRKALITAHRRDWVAFREPFERVFGRKCWYIECANPGTDDDIDHFRPKGSVAESATHGGYWWEALHWRNFRLSCHRANRPRENPSSGDTHGKGDHFPLLREADRCYLPTDDLERERPILLDPIDPEDPPLLTFNIDGTVAVAPEYMGNEDAVRRVNDSRIYLHLEWPRFTEDRQELYRVICRSVTSGDKAVAQYDRGVHGAKDAVKRIAAELIRLTRPNAPYSRAAQAYIRTFRTRRWVEQYVIRNIEVAA